MLFVIVVFSAFCVFYIQIDKYSFCHGWEMGSMDGWYKASANGYTVPVIAIVQITFRQILDSEFFPVYCRT